MTYANWEGLAVNGGGADRCPGNSFDSRRWTTCHAPLGNGLAAEEFEITMGTRASSRIRRIRSPGQLGSSGRKAAPVFMMARAATTAEGERGRKTATSVSGA